MRAAVKHGFASFLKKEKPDVLCLQEIKAPKEGFDLRFDGYEALWNCAKKPGYSGTAILTKTRPLTLQCGIGEEEHDQEGRVLTAEYNNFFLVNVYVPNSKRDLSRLPYRERWDRDFLRFLKGLERKKPVIFCGDLNVAHAPIDLSHPESNEGNHGFTPEERRGFQNFMAAGFLDTFREFHKEGGRYTWWAPFADCRKRNIGWRIDYFCVSESLKPKLKQAFILKDVLGSDHCPVGLTLS